MKSSQLSAKRVKCLPLLQQKDLHMLFPLLPPLTEGLIVHIKKSLEYFRDQVREETYFTVQFFLEPVTYFTVRFCFEPATYFTVHVCVEPTTYLTVRFCLEPATYFMNECGLLSSSLWWKRQNLPDTSSLMLKPWSTNLSQFSFTVLYRFLLLFIFKFTAFYISFNLFSS